MRDNLRKFVLGFLDKVRFANGGPTILTGSDINEFIDELCSDNLDSIHRTIYSFCWRGLFWRRSGGLYGVRQMCQTNLSASSSRANYALETETNVWVSSKSS
jgi:hypothetical protein